MKITFSAAIIGAALALSSCVTPPAHRCTTGFAACVDPEFQYSCTEALACYNTELACAQSGECPVNSGIIK